MVITDLSGHCPHHLDVTHKAVADKTTHETSALAEPIEGYGDETCRRSLVCLHSHHMEARTVNTTLLPSCLQLPAPVLEE